MIRRLKKDLETNNSRLLASQRDPFDYIRDAIRSKESVVRVKVAGRIISVHPVDGDLAEIDLHKYILLKNFRATVVSKVPISNEL